MSKMNKGNKKSKIKAIILCITIPILVVLIPFMVGIILTLFYPSLDGYLVAGAVFYLYVSILISIAPIILIISTLIDVIKKYKEKALKKNYQIYVFKGIIIIIMFIFVSIFSYQGYTYIKDIKNGPQEAIMTDVTIELHSTRGQHGYYIKGNIDGKKTKMKIIRDTMPDGNYKKSVKRVKIYYYENIKEVFKIEY